MSNKIGSTSSSLSEALFHNYLRQHVTNLDETSVLLACATASGPALIQYRYAPKNGVDIDEKTGAPKIGRIAALNYGQSKAGNVMLASEFAKRYGKDGILSVSWNPGNLKTELQRHTNKIMNAAMSFSLYPAKYGAYTELYAACSPELTATDGGAFIAPWGRKMEPKHDVAKALKEKSEGGTGVARQFWEWCEKETKDFV